MPRHLPIWLICAVSLLPGCALVTVEYHDPWIMGGPPSDISVIEEIRDSPHRSLDRLCGEGQQCDANAAQVAAQGWELRLCRLGLPCEKTPKDILGLFPQDTFLVSLKSATPEGIPFTISVEHHTAHPGSPQHQFCASLSWDNPADSQRGIANLRTLEAAKAVPEKPDELPAAFRIRFW